MRSVRSPKLTKAIRHAIREAELAYEFCPGSYSMGALNPVLAVEQVYLREAGLARAVSRSPTTPPATTQPTERDTMTDTMMTDNTKTREAHYAYMANRKEAGRVIDIETCEMASWHLNYFDPYATFP